MNPKLLVAGLLLAASLNLVPPAQADDVSVGPSCTLSECLETVCDALATEQVALDCQVYCTAAQSSPSLCNPVCLTQAAEGASVACPPVCPISVHDVLDGSVSTRVCPLPCTERLSDCVVCLEPQPLSADAGWSIQCPDPCGLFAMDPSPCSPPCTFWNMLSVSGAVPCPVCSWPPNTAQACAICTIRDLCGLCNVIDPCPPSCSVDDLSCLPGPGPIYCVGNGQEPEGLVPATVDYVADEGAIACVLAATGVSVAYSQAVTTLVFVKDQERDTVDWLRPLLTTSFPLDSELVDDARGEAADQGNLLCGYLVGQPTACFAGAGPAPAPCPADFAIDDGVVGATFTYAESACGSAVGAAPVLVGDVREIAVAVVTVVKEVERDAGEYLTERVADAGAYVATTADNAGTLATATTTAVASTVSNTCGYVLGSYTCT